MDISILNTEHDMRRYSEWILTHPQGNLWQSLERKQYLEACGKTVRIYLAKDDHKKIIASALVSIDRTTGGFSTWEIPRGPIYECESIKVHKYLDLLLEQILEDAKKDRCIALSLSPISPLSTSALLHFRTSLRHIYPEATRIIDLTKNESDILAQMHPKGRYNIGVAKKHGIEIQKGNEDDIDTFYELLRSTGGRDGFKISQKSHYARFLTCLEGSFLLLAKHEGKAIAGLIGVVWPPSSSPTLLHCDGEVSNDRTGIYYYGASSYKDRHLMTPYLLQWEAIRHCKQAGCVRYDLLGIEPENENSKNPVRTDIGPGGQKPNSKNIGFWNLNFGISAPQGSWAGITEFKSKFGGSVITYPKEQMIVLRPMMKMMLEWKRRVMG